MLYKFLECNRATEVVFIFWFGLFKKGYTVFLQLFLAVRHILIVLLFYSIGKEHLGIKYLWKENSEFPWQNISQNQPLKASRTNPPPTLPNKISFMQHISSVHRRSWLSMISFSFNICKLPWHVGKMEWFSIAFP